MQSGMWVSRLFDCFCYTNEELERWGCCPICEPEKATPAVVEEAKPFGPKAAPERKRSKPKTVTKPAPLERSRRRETCVHFPLAALREWGGCPTCEPSKVSAEAKTQAEMLLKTRAPRESAQGKVDQALQIALDYGVFDGDHHKTWALDQIIRVLAGPELYRQIVERTIRAWCIPSGGTQGSRLSASAQNSQRFRVSGKAKTIARNSSSTSARPRAPSTA